MVMGAALCVPVSVLIPYINSHIAALYNQPLSFTNVGAVALQPIGRAHPHQPARLISSQYECLAW